MVLVEEYIKIADEVSAIGSSEQNVRISSYTVEVFSCGYKVTSNYTGHSVEVDNISFHKEYRHK